MIIELKQIFEITNEVLKLEHDMDLSKYELFGDFPFVTPVSVKCEIFNRAGVVYLNYTNSFTLKLNCDRCLESFNLDFNNSFEHILIASAETDNDEYIHVENYKLDLDELCLSDILLNLPSKLLCSRNCKGLCIKCGANLNKTDCLCVKKEVDPRLQILGELLK